MSRTECQTPTHNEIVDVVAEEPDVEEVHNINEIAKTGRDFVRFA
jgi:hypothetical protein